MSTDPTLAERLRGATLREEDVSGLTLQECTVTGARIVGCDWDGELVVSAFAGRLGAVVVEGVDVTAHVLAELDRRHPERLALRGPDTAEGLRAAWATIDDTWERTLEGAGRLPEAVRQARVDDEWSLVETLRHLVLAVDIWIGRMVEGAVGFHPLGLPPTDPRVDHAPAMGLRRDLPVSFAEAVAAHAQARARVTATLARLDDAALAEHRTATPGPGWPEQSRTVAACLRVVLTEHVEHHRYAVRDLAVLTTPGRPVVR